MILLATPNISGREGEYLQDCIASTFVSTVGPFVTRFENMVAESAGASHGVATSAGTTGLHAAFVAAGVEAGDLVIAPAMTFVATCNAIAHTGAIPWLMDISGDSWTLNPALVVDSLARETHREGDRVVHTPSGRRVAAIAPVYTLGTPADMDTLVATAREYGLPVVADAAAALGASYKGRATGNLGADLTMYSFNGNKTVTAGGGGAIVGNDEVLMKRLRHLTTTARVGADYDHDVVGFNYRMTNLQAAVGCAQMERLDEFTEAKRGIAKRYDDELGGLPGVGTFPRPEWAESACWFSGIVLDDCDSDRSASLRASLREKDIDARPFWKPMHMQAPFRDAPCSAMIVTEALWTRVLTLPCSTHLTEDEQGRVIAAVRAVLV